ncbi:hypothetical protein BDB00DRAFT_80008 [Zychaea mexicana]|uniref:uncharacterized protein n=1 Tax=Zychaea mexicana TaxID=64656 RepID=UPI0022FEBDDF|nr:uncharacterized protein BDB00DRAFT_80008 [Zychaea mexicana]KAI9496921.1 hypothetical protein BDB00DRAFT_80008 [Zychaea mexicana]
MLFCEQSNGNTGVIDKVNNLTDSTASVVPHPALVNIKNTILPAASFYSSPNKVNSMSIERSPQTIPFDQYLLIACAVCGNRYNTHLTPTLQYIKKDRYLLL